MSSALIWALLVVSLLIFVSTSYAIRNKNTESFEGVLIIILLLNVKAIIYAFEMINFENVSFGATLLTINLSLTPMIASLILLTAYAAANPISRSKVVKQVIGYLTFFFVGVIITNPFHHLAFTLTNVNTVYKIGYTSGLLLDISNIYNSLCILASFLIIVFSTETNRIRTDKTFSFLGSVLALIAFILSRCESIFDLESIVCFGASFILYAYVFVKNDYSFIPIIKNHTFELINEPILAVNKDFIIKDYNKALTKLFTDINFENVIGKKIDDVFRFYPVVIYSLKCSKKENISIEGKNYSLEIYTSVEKNKKHVIHTVTFVPSKSINIFMNQEPKSLDPLTSLKTKDSFIEMITYEYDNAVRYSLPFVLMFIDVDDLTKINKTYGRIAGDLLLTNISALIKKEIRKTDILARIDEDRFALLLTHTKSNYVEIIAERIKKRIEKNALAYEDDLIQATVSIGITGANKVTNQSIDTFIAKVEDALDMAKKQGKNCIYSNFIN